MACSLDQSTTRLAQRDFVSCHSLSQPNNALPHNQPHHHHCASGLLLTISSVQTRLIQTFSFPSTPSTLLSSMPSHQHLRAGFRQNKSSFCAMPTALELAASPRMSVRRRARAIEQMTALFGSAARWPQVSAASKPLEYMLVYVCFMGSESGREGELPGSKHFD